MPRLNQSVPKYRKHKATGQALVTINGRDHYLGPHGTKASKIEYDRRIGEWLASNRSDSYGLPETRLTIAELLAAYVKFARGYYGDSSRGEFANMVVAVRAVKDLYSRRAAGDFGPLELKAARQRFVDAGHCRSNVNANTRRIVRVFRWAVSEGMLSPEVPVALAMVPGLRRGRTTAPEGRKVKPVAPDVVMATLPHLSPTVRAMVELQQLTGMRPGELVILRPMDVDRSGEVWEFRPVEHKNVHREQDRTVYIGPQGQDLLRPFLLRPADAYCFSPVETEANRLAERSAARKTPLSCGNRPGSNRRRKPRRVPQDHYTTLSYARAVQRACDRAFPVPEENKADPDAVRHWRRDHRWAPNQLRHALGTRVRREFDLEAAKTLLGHSQINTTGIYAEQDRRRAIEVAKRIG